MAKAELSSYLTALNGRVEDRVFYTVGKRVYTRKYIIPRNSKSEALKAHRSLFAEAMAEWKLLGEDMKQQYRKKARRLPMHAHNLFIKHYIEQNKKERNTAASQTPPYPESDGIIVHNPGGVSGPYPLCSSSVIPSIQAVYSLYATYIGFLY